jgi:twinkle protein
MDSDVSEVLVKGPCPDAACGSSDACATYSDGHQFCFSCNSYFAASGVGVANSDTPQSTGGMLHGIRYVDLHKRGLRAATLRAFGYGVSECGSDGTVQVAPYHDESGAVVAQKIRTHDKGFFVLGSLKTATLFGQSRWRHGGKMVVVTEGEIDAMSVSQAMGGRWPVVSIPNGASGAVKAIKNNLEWLSSYDSVILWFDNDEPGRAALKGCLAVLPPGKLKIVTSPGDCKDANDVLVKVGAEAVARLVWDAPTYRPDGIVNGRELSIQSLRVADPPQWVPPLPELVKVIRGLYKSQLVILTAGTGVGKSTTSREWLRQAVLDGLTVGAVFLEESMDLTAKALIALDNSVPLVDVLDNPDVLPLEQWDQSYARLFQHGRYFSYDHFGSLAAENLLSKLEYLAVSCGCQIIFLDHISIAVSGLSLADDERRIIDKLMTDLRSLCERTGVMVVAVSHLRKTASGGAGFEDGAQISLDALRGSGSLKQLADIVIALERDQQGDTSDVSTIRVLKCRRTGKTGMAGQVRYDVKTGRQVPVEADFPESLGGSDGF